MTVSSPASLSKLITEFGSDGSASLQDYNRGGGRVPDTAANAAISTSKTSLSLASFVGSNSYFTITVNADWGSVSDAGAFQTSAVRTLTVPAGTGNITLSPSFSGGGDLQYAKNGGGYTTFNTPTGVSVSNGDTITFRYAGTSGQSGTVDVTDTTNGVAIGAFTGTHT